MSHITDSNGNECSTVQYSTGGVDERRVKEVGMASVSRWRRGRRSSPSWRGRWRRGWLTSRTCNSYYPTPPGNHHCTVLCQSNPQTIVVCPFVRTFVHLFVHQFTNLSPFTNSMYSSSTQATAQTGKYCSEVDNNFTNLLLRWKKFHQPYIIPHYRFYFSH